MTKLVKLNSGAFLASNSKPSESGDSIERPVMLVYTGKFASMDGDVEIKDKDIEKLAENHNSVFAKLKRLAGAEDVPARHSPPIQLDHSTSARDTVGRLVGEISVGDYEDPDDGKSKKALFGKMRVLGKENVEKVVDGRWTHVSIGADMKNHKLSELSVTPFPAAANASLLKKGDTEMAGYDKEKMAMYNKCKKHLMDKEKLSEEDADKKLAEMPDEDAKKMAAEHDEHEKKMAAESVKEEEKKKAEMTAKREEYTKLSTTFIANQETAKLKAKAGHISVRLGKLRASAKITPAEIKKINTVELAKKTDGEIKSFFDSIEIREPAIPVGQYGSLKAETPAQIQARLKKVEHKNLEQETINNMPMLKKMMETQENKTRLASDAETKMGDPAGVKDSSQPVSTEMSDEEKVHFEQYYATMSQLMGEGKHEEAKEHLKKMFAMKKMASPAEEHMASDAEEHMSGLEEDMKKMHTNFVEIQKLVAPVLGISN